MQGNNNTKSTPLSQLPSHGSGGSQQQQQGQFVNDQHRQIVAQAQVAAQNFSMPQTTSGLHGSTEDADIQEALALVTGVSPVSDSPQQQQQQQHQQQHQPNQQQQADMAHYQMQQRQLQEAAELNVLKQQHAQLQAQLQAQQQQQQQQQQQLQHKDASSSAPASAYGLPTGPFALPEAEEIRLALIGISVYILVTLLPVSDLLARFLPALDGVPYAAVLARALVLGIALFVGQRAMMFI
jgi:hypothetical protein